MNARVEDVNGRSITVQPKQNVHSTIRKLRMFTIGREDPTNAEAERTAIVVSILQRQSSTLRSQIARTIFLGRVPSYSSCKIKAMPLSSQAAALNASQKAAIDEILSLSYKLGIIQGPPGTGKTTVIARAVEALINGGDSSRTVWLLAQSNVAVKNIAEKLASIGFWDFKLLVSHDFHYDWYVLI